MTEMCLESTRPIPPAPPTPLKDFEKKFLVLGESVVDAAELDGLCLLAVAFLVARQLHSPHMIETSKVLKMGCMGIHMVTSCLMPPPM
mmetsp:Transcript_10792/g.21491  ORF Transcript_10792/g.21491 Transcript_10792/m.21491 type:complete len:88 (-) Transcript_10792:1080-1343(-)